MKVPKLEVVARKARAEAQEAERKLKEIEQRAGAALKRFRRAKWKSKQARKAAKLARKVAHRAEAQTIEARKALARVAARAAKVETKVAGARKKRLQENPKPQAKLALPGAAKQRSRSPIPRRATPKRVMPVRRPSRSPAPSPAPAGKRSWRPPAKKTRLSPASNIHVAPDFEQTGPTPAADAPSPFESSSPGRTNGGGPIAN